MPQPPSQPSVDINSLMNALATADSVSLPAEQPVRSGATRVVVE